jgi:GTPase SAR1 family protein
MLRVHFGPRTIPMVFFNYSTMQMAAKVVYYGPGLCGKTTNLHYI